MCVGCMALSINPITVAYIVVGVVAILRLLLPFFSLGIEKKTKAINDKIENYLETISSERFQIIFFDPPFKEIDYLNHLKLIKEKKIYRNNHLIIIHRDKKSKDDYNKILDPLIVKQYGRSKIIFGIFAS